MKLTHLMVLVIALLVVACGERASTWDETQGRFVSTEDYHRDRIRREIDQYPPAQPSRCSLDDRSNANAIEKSDKKSD